jgi:hypothetical protein
MFVILRGCVSWGQRPFRDVASLNIASTQKAPHLFQGAGILFLPRADLFFHREMKEMEGMSSEDHTGSLGLYPVHHVHSCQMNSQAENV